MKVIAIIPARGGSKGIKKKNLVEINNKPLVAHSIDHALKAARIDRVIVSTDDEEIARVSKKSGAEVPFMRPKALAQDHILDLPVFEHALDYLIRKENYNADIIIHLRPTAPFRKRGWIDNSIDYFINNPMADSLRSVSEVVQHPYRVFEIDKDGFLLSIMKHRQPEPYLLRRQDLPTMYYYNCVIDITKPDTIIKKNSMTGDKILPYKINSDDVFDIDTEKDLKIARLLM